MDDLSSREFQLLKALLAFTERSGEASDWGLKDLAEDLDVSSSYLSRALKDLDLRGWVERHQRRTQTGKSVQYAPVEGLLTRWVSPSEGVAVEWSTHGRIDWQFPLVSRVPDRPARETLTAFFRRLWEEQLLFPSEQTVDDVSFEHRGLSFVAYGSCVRGTATPGSDVDLVGVHPTTREVRPDGDVFRVAGQPVSVSGAVEEIAADVSLGTPRPIQLRMCDVADIPSLPGPFRESLYEEGLIVHDGIRHRSGGATQKLWSWFEGGRKPG